MQLTNMLITGLSLGTIYALVALGFVIVFKASEVLNFAHGTLVVFGAYVTARTTDFLGFWTAALLGIVVTALVALLIERFVIRPGRNSPIISLAILTIGVEIILNTLMVQQIGPDVLPLGQPWGSDAIDVFGSPIPINRLIAFGVAIVLIGAFLAAFRFSLWGVAMRASAEDREAAEIVGLRLGRIGIVAWLIAGALAGVAGIFLTGSPTPGLSASLGSIALRAFPAAILGGLGSVPGALVGGLLIGLSEAAATVYQDQLAFLGRGFGDIVPYAVMMLILLIKPQGIFGAKEAQRV